MKYIYTQFWDFFAWFWAGWHREVGLDQCKCRENLVRIGKSLNTVASSCRAKSIVWIFGSPEMRSELYGIRTLFCFRLLQQMYVRWLFSGPNPVLHPTYSVRWLKLHEHQVTNRIFLLLCTAWMCLFKVTFPEAAYPQSSQTWFLMF